MRRLVFCNLTRAVKRAADGTTSMLSQYSTNMSVLATAGRRSAAIEWLISRINFERSAVPPYNERQLKLDRMRTLLTRLGQPDAALKIMHVAGTKGKGSTSAMLAAMLGAAGYRTGVFSSPHLERIEERFAVEGMACSAEELINLVDRLRPVCRAMDEEDAASSEPSGGPTYFEVTTAMALVHFVERQVDVAILEVGLGGRLDATNVCLPMVSVITSISFDHTQQLGNSLALIAREKAGIIKPGVPVVSGVTELEAQRVIADVAHEHGARLIQVGKDFRYAYRPPRFDFETSLAGHELRLENIPLAMRGSHQAANGAVALAALTELRHQGWFVSMDAMRCGLASAALPGRIEFFDAQIANGETRGRPAVVVDAAHNQASAQALVAALAELPKHGRRTLVLSVSSDKDVATIVRELVPFFNRVVATQYQENPRAVAAEELGGLARAAAAAGKRESMEVIVCATPREAWDWVCGSAESEELVVVAGSFFLAAEMRRIVLEGRMGNATSKLDCQSN
jgi:dihydrofolate synthase / folylpolyglutamate synthase